MRQRVRKRILLMRIWPGLAVQSRPAPSTNRTDLGWRVSENLIGTSDPAFFMPYVVVRTGQDGRLQQLRGPRGKQRRFKYEASALLAIAQLGK
jgi:hypothetical protein